MKSLPKRHDGLKPLVGAVLGDMMVFRNGFSGAAAAVLAGCVCLSAAAAELSVMSAGAARAAVEPLVREFEKTSGHKVNISFGTMGLIQEKLGKGERADVLIVAAEIADAMQQNNVIDGSTRQPLAKVGVGVAVAANAAVPDITTPEAFRQTLLNAKSIVMINPARGTSGKHLVEVYAKLGVTDQVSAKMQYGEGGYIVGPVGEGKVELGLHQISEILPVKGVKLVGPLPEALQKWTVYTAAITPGSASVAAARELIAFLSGAPAAAVYAAKGFVNF